jgi:hypothetical protein
MARTKKEEPLEKIFKLIDKEVEKRGKAVLVDVDTSAEIARLSSEARKQGASMAQITERVRRMDKKERVLKPVTRQAIDIMLATFEQRREPRTTRASRRRRDVEPAGQINADALK